MQSLFITGATGFVGRNLLTRIDPKKYENIFCLSRSSPEKESGLASRKNVKFVRGSLLDVSSYERYLSSARCVIHLAAVTGKARRSEYFQANVEGTRLLLEQCRRRGVEKFLFVSSIAFRFKDKTRYYYAQSKEAAEELVRNSGLRYTILRPTIIFGQGAPVGVALATLSRLPVIPVFGDGKTLVQPIDVGDLVAFILLILERDRFQGEALDLGGREVISIEELLKKIRLLNSHRPARTVHIPLRVLAPLLSALEAVLFPLLPFTVGQLSSFRYNGTIEKNDLFEEFAPSMKTLDQMLPSVCFHDFR